MQRADQVSWIVNSFGRGRRSVLDRAPESASAARQRLSAFRNSRAHETSPPVKLRVCLAIATGMFAAWLLYAAYRDTPGFTADFAQWHLAARTVLNGDNPY